MAQSITNAERKLLRLSEALGAMHYLDSLCQSRYGGRWRTQMGKILEAEAPAFPRRDRYISAFNYGFDIYRDTHSRCRPATQRLLRRHLIEGHALLKDITRYYGR